MTDNPGLVSPVWPIGQEAISLFLLRLKEAKPDQARYICKLLTASRAGGEAVRGQ